jgi:putative hemolysin
LQQTTTFIETRPEEDASFELLSYAQATDPWWKRTLIGLIEAAFGRTRLEKMYRQVRAMPLPAHALWAECRKILRITMNLKGTVPLPGKPLVIVSNHPFGVVDGVLLCELAALISPDFKVLINAVLTRDSRVKKFFLPIDFSETREALRTNLSTKNEAAAFLKSGGVVLIFPSGGVATATPFWSDVHDLPWKPFVVKLIQEAEADVLPVFVEGRNSRLFQLASAIHLSLRLGLLLRETLNKQGKTIRVTLGQVIPFSTLETVPRAKRLSWLQEQVLRLAPPAQDAR